jgi:purine-cytosine permease-like protein
MPMAGYSEVQKAVRVEKLRIWFGWLCGNVIMLIIANGTQNIAVVSVITQVLLVAVFLALTVALFRMTGALNRRAERARREVLGDDYH